MVPTDILDANEDINRWIRLQVVVNVGSEEGVRVVIFHPLSTPSFLMYIIRFFE